jgi:hypothetical protein
VWQSGKAGEKFLLAGEWRLETLTVIMEITRCRLISP